MSQQKLTCISVFGTWCLACLLAWSAPAFAEERVVSVRAAVRLEPSPPREPRYAVELEPHAVMQWTDVPSRTDVGLGLGFRASIPVLDHGPIPHISNNLAVSFGMDWAYLGLCRGAYPGCRGNDFWFPVVMQWNFFLTSWWSVFPELGLAIHHAAWDYRYADEPPPPPGPRECGPRTGPGCVLYADSVTEVAVAAWAGTRFSISDSFSFTLRLGFPSLVAGVSFRL